jgi:protein-L-isoaspartate O-methyltransferase
VLYLCGPEPRNDLEVLLRLGVDPQNVWAIESDKILYDAAVKQLVEDEFYIRVHHGSLETFFEITNEIFDIVYIDACGPLPSGRPSTLGPPT